MQPALRTTWRPLFSQQECAPYRTAVEAVAAELAHPDPALFVHSRRTATARYDGAAAVADLAGGKAGLAVFFAYLHLHTGEPAHRDTSIRLMDEAIAGMAGTAFSPRFFQGWPGVAWAASHVGRLPGWCVDESPVTEIVRVVEHLTRPSCWTGHLDLVSGLTGLGVYALEELPRPAARSGLVAVVERLAEHAEHVNEGENWLAPGNDLIVDNQLIDHDGEAQLGLDHGIPGVITLLAEAHAVGVEQALPLLNRIVSWSLDGIPPAGTSALFPHWNDTGNGTGRSPRSTWSNGASGLAAALMTAATRADKATWHGTAVDLAVRAADTPLDRCMIADHSICRGAAGMAHLYNRMYQATGHEGLREGARTWFRRLLDMRHADSGVGGFLSYLPRRGQGDPWIADAGLMTGAAGAALTMLSAIGSITPLWDRMLLVSVPTSETDWQSGLPPRTCPADGTRSSIPHRPA